MAKFIEVKEKYGKSFLLNIDHIQTISRTAEPNKCVLTLVQSDKNKIFLEESYEEFARKILEM